MPKIHPSAVVSPAAEIADDVEIGPLCYIGPQVKIGPGCRLIAQCHVSGRTTLGSNNILYPFAALGQNAQDYKVESDETYLVVGNDKIFREGTTAHTGTKPGTTTRIGNGCMFMNASHVAHNCQIGDQVILVGFAGLAGYCEIGDHALISGLTGLHQFCRVGRFAIISGGSALSKDVPPFMMAEGRNGGVKMINLVGLQRAGFPAATIRALKNVFKIYYRSELSPANALQKIREEVPPLPEVVEFIEFCANSKRGVLSARHGSGNRN